MSVAHTPSRLETTETLELDPEIRAFRDALGEAWSRHPPLAGLPPAEARRIAELARAPFARGGPAMARTTEHTIGADGQPMRLRIHVPAGASAGVPAMVYMHGGGWHLFSIDTHDRLLREYAARAGIAVIGVDYALSPEARYPHAMRQVVDAFRWVQARGAELGIAGDRIALGGDSAGANLALAAAMMMRGVAHVPPPRALVLNYGAFFRETGTPSHRLYDGPAYALTSDEMRGFWRGYLGERADEPGGDPLAEPLRAPIRSLCGLPPTWLAIAECDVLRDDSVAMTGRLVAAGVDTRAVVYEGTTHSFLEAVETAAVARRALDETSAWLRLRLAD